MGNNNYYDNGGEFWNQIIQDHDSNMSIVEPNLDLSNTFYDMQTPKEIVEELNKYVIGQNKAKVALAVSAYNRLLSIRNSIKRVAAEECYFEKNNLLFIGPTGCGKTHLLKSLSKIVELPLTMQDATTFTSAGYVGRDIQECVSNLATEAERIVETSEEFKYLPQSHKNQAIKKLTEYGIIYIDEVDKVRVSSRDHGKDVNGRSLQEALLKLVEGTEVKFKCSTFKDSVSTENILFVFSGAFVDLKPIVEKRLNKNQIGFIRETTYVPQEDPYYGLKHDDLIKFGIIPELLGRLTTIVSLDNLDEAMIRRIFIEPKQSVLSQITNEFKSMGLNISFTDEAIDYLVEQALQLKLGARGLKTACQETLRLMYYKLPGQIIHKPLLITKDFLEQLGDNLHAN